MHSHIRTLRYKISDYILLNVSVHMICIITYPVLIIRYHQYVQIYIITHFNRLYRSDVNSEVHVSEFSLFHGA